MGISRADNFFEKILKFPDFSLTFVSFCFLISLIQTKIPGLYLTVATLCKGAAILETRSPRKASSHLLAQKSQEPQSECGY